MEFVANCHCKFNLSVLQLQWFVDTLNKLKLSEPPRWPTTGTSVTKEMDGLLKDESYHTHPLSELQMPMTEDGDQMVYLTSNDKCPTVYFHSIIDIVQSLLAGAKPSDIQLTYVERYSSSDTRTYKELYHSNWWKRHGQAEQNIVAVIVYSDATTINFRGRSMHPVYVTLGNFPRNVRNSIQGKRLLGFIPIVCAHKAYRNREAVKAYRRKVRVLLSVWIRSYNCCTHDMCRCKTCHSIECWMS